MSENAVPAAGESAAHRKEAREVRSPVRIDKDFRFGQDANTTGDFRPHLMPEDLDTSADSQVPPRGNFDAPESASSLTEVTQPVKSSEGNPVKPASVEKVTTSKSPESGTQSSSKPT